jgi:hypothetical protein
MLGLPDPADQGRYRWERASPTDQDLMTHGRRMLHGQWAAAALVPR